MEHQQIVDEIIRILNNVASVMAEGGARAYAALVWGQMMIGVTKILAWAVIPIIGLIVINWLDKIDVKKTVTDRRGDVCINEQYVVILIAKVIVILLSFGIGFANMLSWLSVVLAPDYYVIMDILDRVGF